jgi:hypothetical protein
MMTMMMICKGERYKVGEREEEYHEVKVKR